MIVVDTNVVSELMRPEPDARVLAWWSANADGLGITAITAQELLFGAERMPEGSRRDSIRQAVERLIEAAEAEGRLLAYGVECARVDASVRVARERAGRIVGPEDSMIAAICLAGGHALATRNTRHFTDIGLVLHDPWSKGEE